MRIAPITTGFATKAASFAPRNNNINFSGYYGSDEYFEKEKSAADAAGILMGLTLAAVFVGAGALLYDIKNNNSEKFRKEVENIYQSNKIEKDTFTVKDMTYDDKPDLILYKKDGSKVVIDIANQEILEETNNLTPIK